MWGESGARTRARRGARRGKPDCCASLMGASRSRHLALERESSGNRVYLAAEHQVAAARGQPPRGERPSAPGSSETRPRDATRRSRACACHVTCPEDSRLPPHMETSTQPICGDRRRLEGTKHSSLSLVLFPPRTNGSPLLGSLPVVPRRSHEGHWPVFRP